MKMFNLLWRFCLFALISNQAFSAVLTNQLNNNPSPYLAMHGNDPVAWQNWSPDILELARKEEKLVFLSVGYFSCHWCHVMQRESYQNPEVAALLNKYFIPVKIDRELEPAMDGILMNFVQSVRGRGGWPLNAFVTPDGYPVYATLYEKPENFKSLLNRLEQLWQTDRDKISQLAHTSLAGGNGPGKPDLDFQKIYQLHADIIARAKQAQDQIHGGFGNSQKFPMEPELAELLTIYQRFDHENQTGDILKRTLDAMMSRGLLDHINGGFFRYTTDPDWDTPHFEKMLYNNAQLALIYLRAGQMFDNAEYTRVAHDTYAFMINHMLMPDGAFIGSFSAVDKDSKEGGNYLWAKDALKKQLSADEYRLMSLIWNLDEPSRFESGGYLPVPVVELNKAAKKLATSQEQAQELYRSAIEKLRQLYTNNLPPADTKKLAGWNGLALASFAEAARMTNKVEYRQVAKRVRDYLVNNLWKNGALLRALNHGNPLGKSSLQDYGFVSYGLMQWAMLTGEKSDFELARKLADSGYDKFYTDTGWQTDDSGLIRYSQTEDVIADGAIPSPAALLLLTMTRVGNHLGDSSLLKKARMSLNSGWKQLETEAFYYSTQLEAAYVAAGTNTR